MEEWVKSVRVWVDSGEFSELANLNEKRVRKIHVKFMIHRFISSHLIWKEMAISSLNCNGS